MSGGAMRATGSRLALVSAAALALAACHREPSAAGNDAATAVSDASLGMVLGRDDRFRAAAKAVAAAGLEPTFDGRGVYTIFAPTDAAFAALPADQRRRLESKAGRPQLVALLRQHVVPGYITPADLDAAIKRTGGTVTVATVGGAPITLRRQGDVIRIGKSGDGPQIVGSPAAARNGVVYAIDRVLPPPVAGSIVRK